LSLLSNYAKPYYEVAIAGSESLAKRKELNAQYLPNILIIGTTKESTLPLLVNRFDENETYIYVCVDGTCKLPVKTVEKAIRQIKK
jgi:uncharacterized protein YyaL (SSP411 family)